MKICEYISKFENITILAAKVGVDRRTINYWRKGIKMPRKENMERLAKVTNNLVTYRDFYE